MSELQELKTRKEKLELQALYGGASKMLEVLKYLDQKGGLGFDNHKYIREAINGASIDL